MNVRTYYWHDRVMGRYGVPLVRLLGRDPGNFFKIGNAGDIFCRDVISKIYGASSINAQGDRARLLVVGSIAHRSTEQDILCGVGVKSREISRPSNGGPLILGVRGPISHDVLKASGFDLSHSKFQLDPGILISNFFPEVSRIAAVPGKVGFIPHYRERTQVLRLDLRDLEFIDIDNSPVNVARKIAECELVYSSSLHGVIFSHSIGRPCVLVSPATDEPLLKFKDYYASVDLPFPKPLGSIAERRYGLAPCSPAIINCSIENFSFPEESMLRERSIAW